MRSASNTASAVTLDSFGGCVDAVGDGSAVATLVEPRGRNDLETTETLTRALVDEVDFDLAAGLFDVGRGPREADDLELYAQVGAAPVSAGGAGGRRKGAA